MIKVSKSYHKISFIVLSIVISFFMMYIANLIIHNNFDDNINYSLAYNSLQDMVLSKAYLNYKIAVGGAEPILFLYNYYFHTIVSYNISILLLNIIFLVTFYKVLKKYYTQNYQYIFIAMVLSNAYILQFLSDIHRLKFAFIFFFLYLLIDNKYVKNFFLILATITHFQILIFVVYKILNFIINMKKRDNIFSIKNIIIYSLIILLVYYDPNDLLYLGYQALISKIGFYYEQFKISYTTLFVLWFYILYLSYILCFRLEKTFRHLVYLVIFIFLISVVLNFYRLNLLLFGYIYIIELNRLFSGKRFAFLPVISIFIYNFYLLSIYIYDSILIKGIT